MGHRPLLAAVLGSLAVMIVAGTAAPALASPAPVSACPPCADAFVAAAGEHGLDTEIRHTEAVVRAHENGSATWTVRIEPTNQTVLDRFATNGSLARAVAADSFGVRYGDGIDHELQSVAVDDDAVVIRYRTLDVVQRGPLGSRVLTYFRDSPGAYVYTDLGADEVTVVAPPGTTIARGFGDVRDAEMTATELPRVRNGPFVVFAPDGSPVPGILGVLAVIDALGGVIARNLVLFVAVPGGILLGAIAGIRRLVDPAVPRNPTLLGGGIAVGGGLLLAATILTEGIAVLGITGNLLIGGAFGIVLLGLGAGVAVPAIRRSLTGARLVGAGLAIGALVGLASNWTRGAGILHTSLALSAAVLPAVVAVGWLDALGDVKRARQLLLGTAVAVLGGLVAFAPLREVGWGLFLLLPIAMTILAVVGAVVVVPLYLLGAAGATVASR